MSVRKSASWHRVSAGFRGDAAESVPVHIGDLRVAGQGAVLFTVGLGSCVAVALYDGGAGVGGLAHAMLPRPSDGRRDAPPGRFASTAIPQLAELLESHGAERGRLEARLAGGASMFRDLLDREGLTLGRRNVEAARAALEALGIPIVGEDVLGTYGRSVFLRTSDGRVLVTSVNHDDVIL